MPQMSDLYIFVLLRVTGKNLKAEETNTIIDYHTSRLRELKIVEERKDGKIFKAWVTNIDEFNHELLDKNTLICSRRVRFEIRDPLPHPDNNDHSVRVKIHKALTDLRIHHNPDSIGEIIIETVSTHVPGNMKEGRWPKDRFAGAF